MFVSTESSSCRVFVPKSVTTGFQALTLFSNETASICEPKMRANAFRLPDPKEASCNWSCTTTTTGGTRHTSRDVSVKVSFLFGVWIILGDFINSFARV